MKRIALLTSGGDAPGMNSAIRSTTRIAIDHGIDVYGVRRRYAGLIEGDLHPLTSRDVGGILERAGTVLESARSNEFKTHAGVDKAVRNLEKFGIDGLIVIGGNGSQAGALSLWAKGVPVNGVASTIDNDLAGSDMTIGVDTALNVALESIDRLRATASSHHRMFIVEVMGRDCGYLALAAGLAGGAEIIITPEHSMPTEEVVRRIHSAAERNKRHAMIVVAEGSKNTAQELHEALCKEKDSFEPRLTILGHVQRGGTPSAFDRLLATRLAARATQLLLEDNSGFLVGLLDGCATPTPLEEVVGKHKPLPAELLFLADAMKL
jgi:6-phosphofructokinase 1